MNKQIHIEVDWAHKERDETAVVIARKEDDGTITILAELHGDAAEYVAKIESALEHDAILECFRALAKPETENETE